MCSIIPTLKKGKKEMGGRGRDRQTERGTKTDRQTQTERGTQTDRHRDRNRQTQRQTDRLFFFPHHF